MPQNAIIRADGTGDYTTPQAWESAEQSSNYGSITVGRVDGFFDSGSSQLDINGNWPNGARLEAFSSAGAFDGTERQLCGLTSTGITVRGRGNKTELFGLEIYSTATQGAYIATTAGGDTNISSCLLRANSGTSRLNSLVGNGYVNCVLASDSDTVFNGDTVGTGNSIFANEASSVGSTDTITLSNTVVYNDDVGACFRDTVTQSNNASTDATADTLTNIVVADNFVSTTPLTSGDYRIKSGSLLDTNGIGAFVQVSSGITITPLSINSSSISIDPVIKYAAIVNLLPNAINSSSIALNPAIQYSASINITPNSINSLSIGLNPVISYSSALIILPQTINSASVGINPVIEYKGVINLTPNTINSLSVSINPFISTGQTQTVGNVTAGFADDLYSVKYKLSGITVNFKG